MKKRINHSFFAGLIALFSHSVALADDTALFTRYEQAKLRIAYEGAAGNLLQQVAQRLKVGFLTYELDTSRHVSLPNQGELAIKALTEQLEHQLPDADIRFEKIDGRLFLVATSKTSAPLLNAPAQSEQFIGEAIFADTAPLATPDVSSESAQKLKAIIDAVTNPTRIAQSKKKAPQYQVTSKEKLGLQNVRVTPLGTFLMFSDGVEAKTFNVKGDFEALAQHDNLIAISHQDRAAPQSLEIRNAQGKKLTLKKVK